MAERLFLRLDGDPLYVPETDVPAGTMCEFAPLPSLQRHVRSITRYREQFAPGQVLVERVLPDAAVHLVFHAGGSHGGASAAWSGLAVGASTAAALLRFSGRIDGLSVALRPGAVSAVLGLPAGAITGAAVDLRQLWPADATRLFDALGAAADDGARVRALQSVLQQRLQRSAGGASASALHAARLIAASGGRRRPAEAADAVGVGERRLQQIFHAEVGLTPRAYARLARLHACLRALRRTPSPPRWPEMALDAGFYDQSHLVNEFRALCGLTPGEFAGRTSESSKTAV